MRLNERFHQPENFDKVTDGKGWVMYAGGNDWENGCSACCVTRTGNEQLDRVWMTVKCCEGASKDADCSTKESEVFKEHGDKAWRMWEKVARRLHAKVEYTSASSWLDSFKEALTDPEMKPFVDEHGRERTKWSDVEEAAPRRAKALVQAPADLDDPEMILRQQPGFRFVNTSYMGTKVYLEDDPEEHKQDDWPLDIGRVIHGPDPKLVGAMTWYVIGIRGMNDDDLHAANLGTRDRPNLKTFATKEDAAMAIWLIWSRFDDKQKRGYRLPPGPLNRKHEGAAKAVATLLEDDDLDSPALALAGIPELQIGPLSGGAFDVYMVGNQRRSRRPKWIGNLIQIVTIGGREQRAVRSWKIRSILGAEISDSDPIYGERFTSKQSAAMAVWTTYARWAGANTRREHGLAEARIDVAELCAPDPDPNNPPGDFQNRFKDARDHHPDKVGFRYGQLNPGQHQLIYPQDKTIEPSTEPVIEPDVARLTQLGLNLGEALDEEPPLDARSEIDRLLPTKTYRLGGNSMIHAPGVVNIAQTQWRSRSKKDKANGMAIIKSWPGLPESAYLAILNRQCEIVTDGDTAVITVKEY